MCWNGKNVSEQLITGTAFVVIFGTSDDFEKCFFKALYFTKIHLEQIYSSVMIHGSLLSAPLVSG